MATQPVQKPSPPSILSSDLQIVGDLHSEGEIQIDGTVNGDIRTKSLLVGATAVIKGEIVADSVVIHGSINGQVKARDVNLAKTAHVVGDILHENLSIETGAFLEGHCKRLVEKPESDGRINVFGTDDATRRLAKIKEGGGVGADPKGTGIKPPGGGDNPKAAAS